MLLVKLENQQKVDLVMVKLKPSHNASKKVPHQEMLLKYPFRLVGLEKERVDQLTQKPPELREKLIKAKNGDDNY